MANGCAMNGPVTVNKIHVEWSVKQIHGPVAVKEIHGPVAVNKSTVGVSANLQWKPQ